MTCGGTGKRDGERDGMGFRFAPPFRESGIEDEVALVLQYSSSSSMCLRVLGG
jgi:hypothetical protein